MRLAVSVLVIMLAAVAASGAPAKKVKVPKVEDISLREKATEELHPKAQTSETPTPTVMLPLKDSYVPTKGRGWDWSIEARTSSHSIFGVRPQHSYGIPNLASLGSLQFFGVGAGIEKAFWGSYFGLHLTVEGANRKSSFSAPTGLAMPAQVQSFAYGIEPRWSYIFNRWFGTTASVLVQTVNINHSALESPLATWSAQYLERAPKVSADLYLTQTADSRQRISLAFANYISELGQTQSWSLAYGATW